VHPLVREAVDVLVQRSKQRVIVVEAIKLLESPLREKCDRIVVAYAPEAIQQQRLIEKRKLSPEAARHRIAVQARKERKSARPTLLSVMTEHMRIPVSGERCVAGVLPD
jgi:dephospho-CoA kinase